jgi:Spy/CpxP family protein refolding chaperone
MADASQNSVTRDDLRDALAHSGPRRRPTGLLSARPQAPAAEPAWDWDAAPGEPELRELDDLRSITAEQRQHIDELVTAQEAAAETERELREALAELATASLMRRRAVVARLRAHGLI